MKKLVIIVFILLLVPFIKAQTIEKYNLEINLFPSGLASEKISFDILNNKDVSYVEYRLNSIPENIKTDYKYEIVKENNEYSILIYKEIKANQISNIEFQFDLKNLVETSDSNHIFSFQYNPILNIRNFNFKLILPEGFILSEIESPVSPIPKSITTNGRNIIIEWQYNDLNKELPFIVIYERGAYKENNLLFIIPTIVLIAIIIFIIFFYRKKTKKLVVGTLSEDEKQIFNILLRDKETTQKKIVDETKFTKVKVSKIMRRMEEKEIIEKKPYMKTNIIKINKKIKI